MKYLPQFIAKGNTTSIKSLVVDNERKILYILGSSSIEVILFLFKKNGVM